MKTYRIALNKWNLKDPPWSEAIGIEEIDSEVDYAVPPLVAWLTRGDGQQKLAQQIVAALNQRSVT